MPDGKILVLYNSGSGFESSDCRMYKAWSSDEGESWQSDGLMYDLSRIKFDFPFTDCVKPTVLNNGEILAAGYGFLRDRPDMGLSDYAEAFGRYPEIKNITMRSTDNGKTWSQPEIIEHPYDGLELSGD